MGSDILFTSTARRIAVLFLLLWYGLFLVQKIDLTTSDLGRHITNGRIEYAALASMNTAQFQSILSTNFYSYTDTYFPFVNHHWGTGLLFYGIHALAGFGGLSVFFVMISIIAFLIFFLVAVQESNYAIAVPVAALLIPLIGERVEIRPEGLSYLFAALFLWILWNYYRHTINARWLFALPILQMLWVNMHIYFFLGPMLAGIVTISTLFCCRTEKVKIRNLVLAFAGTSLTTLINPFGFHIITYATTIFNNYAYPLAENQTLLFLWNYGIRDPNIVLFGGISALFIGAVLGAWYRQHGRDFISSSELAFFAFLGTGFGVAAFMALRNVTLFGLFAIPALSFAIHRALPLKYIQDPELVFLAGGTIAAGALFLLFSAYPEKLGALWQNLGIGLQPNAEQAATFIRVNHITGPLFNNYDIGGYLIYENDPEKVFVDNRPEAYPASFFTDTYIPMQQDETIWHKMLAEYSFNAIVFGYHDLTPWSQQFLIARLNDQNWAPIYGDRSLLIFVRRTANNGALIKRYEIPRSAFTQK